MMNISSKIFLKIISLLFFTILISRVNYAQEILLQKSLIKFNYGDSLEWKLPEYNDSNWELLFGEYIDNESENLWIRTKFYSDGGDSLLDKQQIIIEVFGTYEVYWNGHYIGNNCISGSDMKSGDGVFTKNFMIPDSLIINENLLALRIFIDDEKDIFVNDIYIENSDYQFRRELYAYGFLLALVILHFLFLFLFITNPLKFSKLQVIYFSILLTSILLALVYEVFLLQGLISYHHYAIISLIGDIQNVLLLIGITIFYFEEFNIKNNYIFLLPTAAAVILMSYFNIADAYLYFVGFLPAISLLVVATIKKKVAALQSLIFMLIIFAVLYTWYGFTLNDISFIVLSTFFAIRKIRLDAEKVKQLHQAELRSARLETEMLKKTLQPHYIMNSLNAVLEWIEESPRQGLKFIKELSDEFRTFLRFSDKKFVTIREELKLCENHLKIMEFRHHKKYLIKTKIENINQSIPPAVLHTIVENGITHNHTNSSKICFIFEDNSDWNKINIRVINNYSGNCDVPDFDSEMKIKNKFLRSEKIIEGNGYKYIRSKLSESYDNNWELTYFGDDSVWITDITIVQ